MPTPPPDESDLFAAALELSGAERAGFLDQACAGDAPLRAAIERLLAAHERARSFMDAPAESPTPTVITRHEEGPGDRIGRYKLLQKIGEGGCGTVYMAEQEEPVRRRVALKVIKLGMDTHEVIARFEAERQALALMEHPNIAKVLDAGATATGRPFFVMELVRGVPITRYCDEHNLATAARLQLFTQVCHAVQHAHQKGIIHRDLKPSNILVTLHDSVPVPKVIDFGIAKATQGKLTDHTLFTAFEQFIGTPAYMSPEQAEMSGLDIDTRSDIYSLGVLLYELLTGRPPFDPRTLLDAGLDEIRRVIREVDPPRPSTRLSTLTDADRVTIAKQRGTQPAQLSTLLRGDLDWIVMRCLEKDRTRRYETASTLAADIVRHLTHEPVTARPPSTTYRIRKAIRRNRLAFAAGSAIIAALFAGVAVSTWQAIRAMRAEELAQTRLGAELAARREAETQRQLAESRFETEQQARAEAQRQSAAAETQRALAQAEAAISKAVRDFLVEDLLRQADSSAQANARAAPTPDIKVREALDRAAQKVGTRFASQPLTEAAVRMAIGSVYYAVGEPAKAAQHHFTAAQLRTRGLGAEHPDTLLALNALALARYAEGKYAEAITQHGRVLEIQQRVLGPEHPDTLNSMNNLGGAYVAEGRTAEGAALLDQAVALRRRILGAEHQDTLTSTNNLATVYESQGKLTEAAGLYVRTLEIQQRTLGGEHPSTLRSMNNLANVYRAQGRIAEAAKLSVQVLETRKRVLGPEHPETLAAMNNTGNVHLLQGRYAEAAALFAQTAELRKRVAGEEHPDTLNVLGNLSTAYFLQGKFAEALSLRRQLFEISRRVLGAEHPGTVRAMSKLASAHGALGQHAEETPLATQALELAKRVLGPEHPDTLTAMNGLAQVYRTQNKFAEAAALQLQTWELQKRVLGAEHPFTLTSMNNLAVAYRTLQRFPEASALFAETAEIERRTLGEDHANTLSSMSNLASVHLAQRRFAEAESLLLQIDERLKQRRGAANSRRPVLQRLVQLYTAWNKPDRAAEWQKTLDELNLGAKP